MIVLAAEKTVAYRTYEELTRDEKSSIKTLALASKQLKPIPLSLKTLRLPCCLAKKQYIFTKFLWYNIMG